MDETYVRVKGRWCYLYRAIDSRGATIDFLLSAFRDADAAKRLFRKALGDRSHPVWSRKSTGLKRRGLQPLLVSSDCLLRRLDKAYNPAFP